MSGRKSAARAMRERLSRNLRVKRCSACGHEELVHALKRTSTCCQALYDCPGCAMLRKKLLPLAMLAAETPIFFNPLDVYAAKELRDQVLRQAGYDPETGNLLPVGEEGSSHAEAQEALRKGEQMSVSLRHSQHLQKIVQRL